MIPSCVLPRWHTKQNCLFSLCDNDEHVNQLIWFAALAVWCVRFSCREALLGFELSLSQLVDDASHSACLNGNEAGWIGTL
jgi:hypothetical protein